MSHTIALHQPDDRAVLAIVRAWHTMAIDPSDAHVITVLELVGAQIASAINMRRVRTARALAKPHDRATVNALSDAALWLRLVESDTPGTINACVMRLLGVPPARTRSAA